MTTPTVPVRFEFSVTLPGTPEQVWQAIATGPGLSAWFVPTEVEEHVGGEFVQHMGETPVRGTVGGWEPPHRFVMEEPEWAALAGHAGADVTPLVTEFLIEADSGGTCVLRVVSSAFGTGADWEQEFMGEAERYWVPTFEQLRLYLTHFPGQRATTMEAGTDIKGAADDVLVAVRSTIGADTTGDRVDLHGLGGEVHATSEMGMTFRYVQPQCGYANLLVFPAGEGTSRANVTGYYFGPQAADVAARQQKSWSEWLDRLPAVVD
jgi:uncharacterized protein YndB with AHSA1/START domain